jgi:hypothetical protein
MSTHKTQTFSFRTFWSILRGMYLDGQQNAYFSKYTQFSRYAYLGYLLGQK